MKRVEERLTPGELFFGPGGDGGNGVMQSEPTEGHRKVTIEGRPTGLRLGPEGVFEPVVIPATLGSPTVPPSDLRISIANAIPAPRPLPPHPSSTRVAMRHGEQQPEFYIVLCTYHAMGLGYYKFTVDGVNIILFNLLFVTFFCLFDFYVLKEQFPDVWIASTGVIFTLSLLATVPLAYFIGMGVASITSATGNLALGAVINATFGSIIEILLYCLALLEGKYQIVEGAIIGSLLCGLLALPGVSMFAGGLRYKEQKFNAKSAGVTSTLLIMAVGGLIAPTIFQEIYGSKKIHCVKCHGEGMERCEGCRVVNTPGEEDAVFWAKTRWVMYTCALALVVIYVVGMVFMLRTHRGRIYGHGGGGGAGDRTSLVGGSNTVMQSGRDRRSGVDADGKGRGGRKGKGLKVVTGVEHARGLESAGPVSAGDIDSQWGMGSMHSASGMTSGVGTGLGTPLERDQRDIRPMSQHMSPYIPPRMERVTSQVSTYGSPRLRPTVGDVEEDAVASPVTLRRRNVNPNYAVRTSHAGSDTQPPPLSRNVSTLPAAAHGGGETGGDGGEAGGHAHANWGLGKSFFVLFACTVLYSLVAEVLIDSVDVVLEGDGAAIGEKFLGVTIVAVVPTVTEFCEYGVICGSVSRCVSAIF